MISKVYVIKAMIHSHHLIYSQIKFYNKKNITLSDLWQQRVLVLPGYSGEALKCVVISEKDPLIDKGSPEAGKRITAKE